MGRHRWEITWREFVEKLLRDYGIEVSVTSVLLVGSLLLEKDGLLYAVPNIGQDDIIPLSILRRLCAFYRVPPLDFGLDPEEED